MTRFHKKALLVSITLLFFINAGVPKRLNGFASAATQNDDSRWLDVQSVSGKITAVEPHTFVIKIEQVKPPGEESSQEDHISSMTFRIDSKTRMEGKLEVGASADIVYRQRNTQYVAVTVHVTPTSS